MLYNGAAKAEDIVWGFVVGFFSFFFFFPAALPTDLQICSAVITGSILCGFACLS